jgi:hypothetical protein
MNRRDPLAVLGEEPPGRGRSEIRPSGASPKERIHMSRLFKRWWMLVAAIMTALAVVLAGAVPGL